MFTLQFQVLSGVGYSMVNKTDKVSALMEFAFVCRVAKPIMK